MSGLKQSLRLERIDNRKALAFLDAKHPLGAGSRSITFALGVFWLGRLEGALTFGCPISNQACRKYGLRLCDALELRKMWLSDVPPMLVRKHYPKIKLLLTYCDNEESAAAYRGSGWMSQEANRYVREVRINGKWYSVRDANRRGITSRADEKKYEHRRKWILPLSEEMKKTFRAGSADSGTSPNPGRKGRCNSDPGAMEPQTNRVAPESVLA